LVLEAASGLQVPPLLLKEHTVQHTAQTFYKEKLMYIAAATFKKELLLTKPLKAAKDLKRKELLGASL
jgi:hypothetical protein